MEFMNHKVGCYHVGVFVDERIRLHPCLSRQVLLQLELYLKKTKSQVEEQLPNAQPKLQLHVKMTVTEPVSPVKQGETISYTN